MKNALYKSHLTSLSYDFYTVLDNQKAFKKTLSRPLHSKLKKVQGLFTEKWNSRTFQGLPLKFKDFSRPCGPCQTCTYSFGFMDQKTVKLFH